MVEIYWACLVGGLVFSVVSLLAGDLFQHGTDLPGHVDMGGHDFGGHDFGGHEIGGHDIGGHADGGQASSAHGGSTFDYLNPTTIVAAITIFGGIGVLLTEYTSLEPVPALVFAAAIGFVLSLVLHFVYVRPMRRSENSVGFSVQELPGRVGQITIPVPADGYGEIMVRIGASNICEIAASHDGRPIPAGESVVVTEIRGDVVVVAPFDEWKQLSGSDTRALDA